MRLSILLLTALLAIGSSVFAQQDIVYFHFENIEPNYTLKASGKHKDDPDPRTFYPFDGGRIYMVPKKVGSYVEKLSFGYKSYTPDWMDYQFYSKRVNTTILKEKDFKGRQWIEQTKYSDIIEYFTGRDKVIMLLDQTQIKGDSAYLVRVYFNFTADE